MKHPTCRLRVLVSGQATGTFSEGVGVLETSRGSPLTEPDKRSGAGSSVAGSTRHGRTGGWQPAVGSRLPSPAPGARPQRPSDSWRPPTSRELRVRLWFRFMVGCGAGALLQRACFHHRKFPGGQFFQPLALPITETVGKE